MSQSSHRAARPIDRRTCSTLVGSVSAGIRGPKRRVEEASPDSPRRNLPATSFIHHRVQPPHHAPAEGSSAGVPARDGPGAQLEGVGYPVSVVSERASRSGADSARRPSPSKVLFEGSAPEPNG